MSGIVRLDLGGHGVERGADTPGPGSDPTGALDTTALLALYAPADRARPSIRVNFIESLDGSATVADLSGALGSPADKAVFDVLRAVADVVLVGAGTARAESYGALTVGEGFVDWRRSVGLSDHPAMALVSGHLDLDPASALFTKAPTPPLVFTTASAPQEARARLSEVATVIDAGDGDGRVDPHAVRAALLERGLAQVLCEGGPSLFGDLIAEDLVDEFCLTLSPMLEGGRGPRIAAAHGAPAPTVPRDMQLAHVLRSDSMLLTRWVGAAATTVGA